MQQYSRVVDKNNKFKAKIYKKQQKTSQNNPY